MIEVQGLTKRYGNKVAVNDISFTVDKGEILGFLGPNGAGKSTTMNILTGYLSSDIGKVVVGGFDILDQPDEAKRKIGYLPENPPLYMDMTVKEYLDFVYDLKKVKIPRKKHLDEICRTVKIADVYDRLIKNLSKGYKQRVGLAQALIGNPEVLVLDEPTVGLDPKQIIDIRNLIKSLGEKHTVILSSHILPEIQAVCDRIIIINQGRIVADDSAANLSANISTDHRMMITVEGNENEVYKTLSTLPGMREVITLGSRGNGCYEYSLEAKEGVDIRRELNKRLAARNWPIMALKSNELTLEDIFLKLISSETNVEKFIRPLAQKAQAETAEETEETEETEEAAAETAATETARTEQDGGEV